MSRQPPQPKASISPYPIQEPLEVDNSPTLEVTGAAEDEADSEPEGERSSSRTKVAGLVAAGVGAIGVASAIFFASRDRQGRSRAKTGKRKGTRSRTS
jgi:hypothetical protein